ncbi:MAG: stage II sporulation protein M [Acidimicrobiia bacterium]
MTADEFIAERRSTWADLEALVGTAGRRAARLPPSDVLRLGSLYREAAADLALARQRFGAEPFVVRLEDLVGRARTLVYSSEPRRLSVGEFVSTGYWRRVRERPLMLVVAVLLLVVPAGLSLVWATRDPAAASGLVPAEYQAVTAPREAGQDVGLPADQQARFSGEILTNNIRVTILAFAGGILFAVPAALILLYNAVLIGTVFGMAIWAGNGRVATELVAPHGVLELSCMVVSAVAGMRLGWALIDPGLRRRADALREEARPAVELVLGTAALLVIAGLVEGFVTGTGLSLGQALAVGFGLGGAFWVLVIWRGRPAEGPADAGGGSVATQSRRRDFARR